MRQVGAYGDPDRARRPDIRQLHSAHDAFVETGTADDTVRPLVLESWRRSLQGGLDPEHSVAPFRLDPEELAALRERHPLTVAMPVIRQLLVQEAEQAGLIVAVSDAAGRLLWVEGNHRLRSRAEQMNFVEGTSWTEHDVGTNAPGTALALDREVQIFRAEHLARNVTPWSCAAAPVHDPDTGSLLGVLDVTGGDDVIGPTSQALIRATVRAVESELRLDRLLPRLDEPGPDDRSEPGRIPKASRPRLNVLGRHTGEWRTGSQQARLSLRHSEILVLLQASADGLTGDELGAALTYQPLAAVSVRAELSRLRQTVVPYTIQTRPYRLDFDLNADVARLRDALRTSDHRQAVELYRGPLLPQSEAPAIVELRTDLHLGVRRLLLDAGDPDSLLRFVDTDFARDDLELWEAAADMLPDRSPRRAEIDQRIDQLQNADD